MFKLVHLRTFPLPPVPTSGGHRSMHVITSGQYTFYWSVFLFPFKNVFLLSLSLSWAIKTFKYLINYCYIFITKIRNQGKWNYVLGKRSNSDKTLNEQTVLTTMSWQLTVNYYPLYPMKEEDPHQHISLLLLPVRVPVAVSGWKTTSLKC